MDYFGINSAEDLPKIREVLAEQMVEPTIISSDDFEQSSLVVSDEGELIIEEGSEDIIKLEDAADSEEEITEKHVNGHAFELEIIDDEEADGDELEIDFLPETSDSNAIEDSREDNAADAEDSSPPDEDEDKKDEEQA
jgi:segregation and condensation protein B